MSTRIGSKPLASLWKRLSGSIAAAGHRGAPLMAVVSIRQDEGAQADELIGALLEFAQTRGLGVEHNLVKNRLVFYGNATVQAQVSRQALQAHHPNVLAFPMKSVKGHRAR